MRFFDGWLNASLRSDADLSNLAYFGAAGALVTPPVRRELRDADEARAMLEGVLLERARVIEAGIRAAVALGVHPEARPRRTHLELWPWLAERLAEPEVDALGVISLGHEESASVQCELAARAAKPVVVAIEPRAGADAVSRTAALAAEAGVPSNRLFMVGCDYTSCRAALELGALVGIDVSPAGLGTAGADLIIRYGDAGSQRFALASAGAPACDVLAVAKVACAVRDAGMKPPAVDGILYGNAARFFERD